MYIELINRYGGIFKTHIFGQPTIITISVETTQFVFQNEGQLFKIAYPDAFVSFIGENNIVEIHGPMHLTLRELGLNLMGFEKIKANLVQDMEKQVIKRVDTWEESNIIQLKEEATKKNYIYLHIYILNNSEVDGFANNYKVC